MSLAQVSHPWAYGKRAVELLVHSNLFISISATSVAISTIILADLSPEALPLFIVFAVTLFVYSFNRIADLAEDRHNLPERSAFVDRYGKPIFTVGTLLYAVATVLAIWQSVPGSPGLLIPLIIAVAYSVLGLKRILLVKNLLVGVAWGLIPVGVGVYYGALDQFAVQFMIVFITVMITIAAIVFDIKDVEGDAREGISTVPIVFGVDRTRLLAVVTSSVVFCGVSAMLVMGTVIPVYGVFLVFIGYVIGYSLVATEDRSVLFYGFIIDGEHILLAGLLAGYAVFL